MTDYKVWLSHFIQNALEEDLGDGDHTSLSSIPANAEGKARLLVKEKAVLSGVEVASQIFSYIDPSLRIRIIMNDGQSVQPGDVAFIAEGKVQSILKAERLVLNVMQRMSGIATQTARYVEELRGLKTRVLDTRKTTPGMRYLEKEAVRHGGGMNHRMGLFDMILLKDNHIDYAGGIEKAVKGALAYREEKKLNIPVEVEARSLQDVTQIVSIPGVDRVMFDNFNIEQTQEAVIIANGKMETESSGGITLSNLRAYAECGVDFISVGALTHHVKSIDLSLKAFKD